MSSYNQMSAYTKSSRKTFHNKRKQPPPNNTQKPHFRKGSKPKRVPHADVVRIEGQPDIVILPQIFVVHYVGQVNKQES